MFNFEKSIFIVFVYAPINGGAKVLLKGASAKTKILRLQTFRIIALAKDFMNVNSVK